MTKNAVAKVDEKSTAMATYDYGADAGAGFDARGTDDISLPFLNILQPMSPQVVDETVEGAKAGRFFNTVTGEVSERVRFVWCHDERKFVEWIPRDAGGGIAGVYEPSDKIVLEAKKAAGRTNKLKVNGNDLVETRYVYGLILDGDDNVVGFGVIPAKSTSLKPVKDWYTSMLMVGKNIPVFAFRADLGAEKKSNDQGTWYQLTAKAVGGNWRSSLLDPKDPAEAIVLQEAKSLREMIISGAAKVDYSAQAATGDSSAGAADEAVPF